MSILHFVKASDIEFRFCFLEISKAENMPPFMGVRIFDDKQMSMCLYSNHEEIVLSAEEWKEIHDKALSFYNSEIENEEQA